MYDANKANLAAPDRAPFDVTTLIEGELQALAAERAGGASRDALRRLADGGNRAAARPKPADDSALDASATAEGAAPPRYPLLEERQTTHGSFEDNAIISQAIKDLFRAGPGWLKLTAIERESMDMIALKFSRILSGRSMEKQHWEDVVGYAKLVEEKCF